MPPATAMGAFRAARTADTTPTSPMPLSKKDIDSPPGSKQDERPLVLVVEDELDLAELLRFNLEQEGYAVAIAGDGETAIEMVRRERPALIVLDLMLPGLSGLEVCRRLRGDPATTSVPVVIATAKTSEADRVIGLELGADDYVSKPYSPRELVARVRAVLRRAHAAEPEQPRQVYEKGWLRIDFDTYEVFREGRPVGLSLREFELLRFFARSPNRVYGRLQILDMVWGQDTHVEPRTVDVHVRRLRKRIERNSAHPQLILTVRGVGYKFNERALE